MIPARRVQLGLGVGFFSVALAACNLLATRESPLTRGQLLLNGEVGGEETVSAAMLLAGTAHIQEVSGMHASFNSSTGWHAEVHGNATPNGPDQSEFPLYVYFDGPSGGWIGTVGEGCTWSSLDSVHLVAGNLQCHRLKDSDSDEVVAADLMVDIWLDP